MKIVIGADHAGFDLKELVVQFLKDNKYEVTDCGTHDNNSTDYPDFAHKVANAVNNHSFEAGILLCGSANGVAITANKYTQVRAAICWTAEIARLARQHNHANLLCLPARFITIQDAFTIIESFFNTQYEGGRHLRRVEKINQIICS